MADPDPVGDYCDYLDKEMTIMGLLTAFAIAVPAVVLDRTAGAKPEEQEFLYNIWKYMRPMIAAGTLLCFLSALSFYLQRSLLAYFIGQLRLSCTEARYSNSPTKKLLDEADSWATWMRYTTAFAFLIVGLVFYAVALFASDFDPSRQLDQRRQVKVVLWVLLLAVLYLLLNWYVRTKHRYEDYPWRRFLHLPTPQPRSSDTDNHG